MTANRPRSARSPLIGSLIALSLALTLTACASTQIATTPANVVVATGATPELSTFAQLVKQAGLQGSLASQGPLTVFAPSNEAFQALPPATLDRLSQNPEELKALLNYHVVPGLVKSGDINGSQSVATAAGSKVTLSKAGDFVTVDDGLVTTADVAAGNGVIHVIDRVLTPPKK